MKSLSLKRYSRHGQPRGFLLVEMIIALVLISALTSFVLPLVSSIGRQQQAFSGQVKCDLTLMNAVAFVHAEPETAEWQNAEWLKQKSQEYSQRLTGQDDGISLAVRESQVTPSQNILAVQVTVRKGTAPQQKSAVITTWVSSATPPAQEEPNE